MENWLGDQDVNNSLISAVCEGNLERAKKLIDSFGLSYSQAWSQGYILLRDALRHKHTAVAELLLTNGSEVNHNTRRCVNTPLHFAVMNGDIEIIMMILDEGAYVDARNEDGMTPLHVAVEMGYLQIVDSLLDNGANVNCMCTWREEYTPLHFAVGRGSTEVVTLLLSRGAAVNYRGNDGLTPLHIVAENGYTDIAEILLNNGAHMHSSTLNKGYTPLHFASKRGNEDVMKLFLTRGADIEARTKDDSTPLHVATNNGCKRAVELLLQHGAKVDNQDKEGRTTLFIAVEEKNSTIVENILKYCPDINNQSNKKSFEMAIHAYAEEKEKIVKALLEYGFIVDAEDANDCKLLHAAVEKGYLKIVEDLLNYGADVNTSYNPSCTDSLTTPLHTAADNEQEEVAELLISYGADINAQDEGGKTPIFYAIRNADFKITKLLLTNGANIKNNPDLLITAVRGECMEIVEALLQHDADINASDGYGAALHFTVLFKSNNVRTFHTNGDFDMNLNAEIAKLLLSTGANVNAQTRDGYTTLHAAAENGHVEVVTVLLECDANIDSVVNTERKDGINALHLATRAGHEGVVKVLLERGARVDPKTKDGSTPLHLAAGEGYQEIIETLLEFGADINSRDEWGRTALYIASQRGHDKIVATLLDYGSDINTTSKENKTALDYAPAYSGQLTAEVLKRHIVKMKTVHLYISEENLLSMSRSSEMSDFQDECEEEIARMKSEKVNDTNISFYDILAKNTNSVAICMKNENIVQVLKSDDYKTKFPIYASIIGNNFNKGIKKKELLEQGNIIVRILFNNFPELPYDCVEKIITYLSDEDLRNLIDACKHLGISNLKTNSNDVEMISSISQVQCVQVEEK